MKIQSTLNRNAHFLGSKIRGLRKQSGLTLEDLSVRCIHIDAHTAPSVSYLSLIETGKRVPSEELLKLFAEIFQKDINWFLDDNLSHEVAKNDDKMEGLPIFSLEHKILFSDNQQLNNYSPLHFLEAFDEINSSYKPDLFIFGHTYETRDWVPRLSA